jgi:hypothetical protein
MEVSDAHHSASGPTQPVAARKFDDMLALADALRTDVKVAEAARRRANHINLGALALLTVLVALLIAVTWQNNRLAHRVDRTNAKLADCTTPGGRCYDEGRARTGQAIDDIIRSEIFMAECSRLYPNESGPAYDRKLEACVVQRLAGPGLRAPAQPTPTPSVSGGG